MNMKDRILFRLLPSFFIAGLWLLITGFTAACNQDNKAFEQNSQVQDTLKIIPAANRTTQYFPKLKDKTIALVANPTSRVNEVHLLDTLLAANIDVDRVLAPEHGFRGKAEAGEHVKSGVDTKTGVQVISLYGSNRKPKTEDLQGVDLVIFDIQDVGVRFYTYISTMHYVMEKCAEMGIEFMVLDRPNPNGFYVDGPVLDKKHSSFVGMHEIPLVHGMTPGELAEMINEEGWLQEQIKVDLQVIPVKNYSHDQLYDLPVAPSPNLPNMKSIYLYPFLGLFEGTPVSIGRGTEMPFQVIGHPEFDSSNISFTPRSIPGVSKHPKFKDEQCYGWDLRDTAIDLRDQRKLHLNWLIHAYNKLDQKEQFFKPFFQKLSGTDKLKEQIIQGKTEDQIRKSWENELTEFKKLRKKYLLYPDF